MNSLFSMLIFPIIFVFRSIYFRDNSLCTRFPLSWANFTMFFNELEGLHKSNIFVNISSYREVINRDVSHNSLWINDESTSISSTLSFSILNEYSIISCNLLWNISKKRNSHISQSTFFSGLLTPFSMNELRITRATKHFSVHFTESVCRIIETNNFSWAYKCEVKWVEEEEYPFTFECTKADVLNTIFPS